MWTPFCSTVSRSTLFPGSEAILTPKLLLALVILGDNLTRRPFSEEANPDAGRIWGYALGKSTLATSAGG